MTAAQRARYDLIQERNELQRTIYKYDALQRTRRMVMSTAAAGIAGAGVVAGVTAVKQTAALEDGFAKIQRTSGLTGKAMADVADSIRDLSREMPIAITEIQKIVEVAAQLGISGSDNLMSFTKTIGMLSDATGIAGDQLATDFAKMLNVFKISATESEKYASVLSKLSVESTATADSILNMTRRIAGSGSTMGLTAEQVMALAAATIDVGASAEVGGTTWTNLIMDMMMETKKWADTIGMAEDKLKSLFSKDPAEAIRQIVAALNSMDREQRVTAMASLGIDSARALNTIQSLANAAELLDKHLKSAKDELASGETLGKQFAITSDTLSKQWQLVKNEITLAAEALAMGFNNSLKDSLKWMRELAELSRFMGDEFGTRKHLETLSDEELTNMFMNRKARRFGGKFLGWRDAGLSPQQQALAGDVLQKRKEAQDKAFREGWANAPKEATNAFDQAVLNMTEWSGPWINLADKFASKVRENLAKEAALRAEIDAWAQPWLDQNVASDRDAMLGAFGVENDPVLEAERLLGLRDNGVDEIAQRRMALGMDIANQLADQPEFRSQFQGVDQLWRDLQTGSMTKTKTPEQLAEEQIEKMEKAIEVAKKVAKHLEDNGIIIPVVGP